MTSPLRAVLAAAFFVIIGGVLAIPVLTADEGDVPPRGDRPAATATEEPTPEPPRTPTPPPEVTEPPPEPTPSEEPEPVELATVTMTEELPQHCFINPDFGPSFREPPGSSRWNPGDDGLVASYTRGKVSVAAPSGARKVTFDALPPVGFSTSGKWLATGEGLLWGNDGSSVGPLFGEAVSTWAWMPKSDCALGITGGKLLVAIPEGEITTVAEGQISGFAVSPNGRRLALMAGRDESQTISLVDLTAPMEKPPAWPFKGTVGGWLSRSALTIGPGAGSGGKMGILRAVAPAESASRIRRVRLASSPYKITPEVCGRTPVGVVGKGRGVKGGHQIAELVSGPTRLLTDPSYSYADPSCSPDGDFMVAVRAPSGSGPEDRRLVLLDRNGSFMNSLTSDERYSDEFPDWGPDGTGVTFVRRPLDGGPAQIWYLSEGAAAARSTGLRVATPVNFRGRFEWRRFVDWSATPPLGVPPF